MTKVAINGFGRIGRLFLRQVVNHPEIQVVAINDLGDIENLAYLLKYDSVYHTFDQDVSISDSKLVVQGKEIAVFQEKDPGSLPWKDLGVDIVVESTGAFNHFANAKAHITLAGAKKVIITAPAKDQEGTEGGKTVLIGTNNEELKVCDLSSNGSCTTNATAPAVAVMDEAIGIKKAILTTIHGYTATQSTVDSTTKGKDFRKGRAISACDPKFLQKLILQVIIKCII